jgi:hypothetical protein
MKNKILITSLLITSLIGYLEWGKDNHAFLWEAEMDVIQKIFSDPKSMIHPFILIPLLGQILLLISLFQKQPNPKLIYTSIGGIGLLLVFMLVVGILSGNVKIIVSTLPFLGISLYTIKSVKNK